MKDIQKLKKQLLMEELRRQGKAPRKKLWIAIGVVLALLAVAGGFWYRSNRQARLEETFQAAVALREAGSHEAAAEGLLALQAGHPNFFRSPRALFLAAEIQDLYLGRHSDAVLNYLLLERDYPMAPEVTAARRQLAELFKFRLNDCGQAITVYQKILDQPGGDGDQLQYEVADCYFRMNNFEQARIEFESLLKNFTESGLLAEVQYRIAVTYALERKLPEAVGAFRLVIQRWPESPYALEARFGLAGALEDQEELVEALKILEELTGVYPKPDILERKTGQVRERIAKKRKAI